MRDEPIIAIVNQLIQDAINKQVSDIHIEPHKSHCRIRYRLNGLLIEAESYPLQIAERIITRLKIMADMNIAERRLPQDGRIQLHQQNNIDIRISTCPTLFGEKMVLRLLNVSANLVDLASLGLTDAQHQLFMQKLADPQGLILVTGPTGSGKTISLYAALNHLNKVESNIATVEDPVEIELPGINQITLNPHIGLGFATALRSFLRQDPDIIMIGEIRDLETATIAMQASQTGHLVLSTLHTNSAIDTLSRLKSLGVDPYQLAHSISLIIAQRLVRKLCDHCKTNDLTPTIYKATGCSKCHLGYQGRIGIFELLPMTKQLSQRILSGQSIAKINHSNLRAAGLAKVHAGLTSFNELARVLTNE